MKIRITILVSIIVLLSSFSDKKKEIETEVAPSAANFGQLKAAFKATNGKAYFFTDKKYYRQNLSSDRLEKNAVINGNWKGVPNNIDAALLHINGKGYFLKGSTYYRYSFSTDKVDKTGKIGKDGWKGVPSNIDAAVLHTNGKAYFFKDNNYYRYSSSANKVDKIGKIGKDGWKGVPNNIDAALRHTNGKIYFFKGNRYYRYSNSVNKVDKIGTIGKEGWKGLSFDTQPKNVSTSSKDNIKLKVTLTRIKSVQARDSDNLADFRLVQAIDYKAKGKQKREIARKIKIGYDKVNSHNEKLNYGTLFSGSREKQIHVREGDENHFINNSLTYEITPQEIADQRSVFTIKTLLVEESGGGIFLADQKFIAKYDRNDIEVSIYEVLEYLQNPNSSKYGGSYFKGGRDGTMHEYGAYGDVMWMKKGSNNSLIGHLEFGDNSKETFVRLYYRFELIP